MWMWSPVECVTIPCHRPFTPELVQIAFPGDKVPAALASGKESADFGPCRGTGNRRGCMQESQMYKRCSYCCCCCSCDDVGGVVGGCLISVHLCLSVWTKQCSTTVVCSFFLSVHLLKVHNHVGFLLWMCVCVFSGTSTAGWCNSVCRGSDNATRSSCTWHAFGAWCRVDADVFVSACVLQCGRRFLITSRPVHTSCYVTCHYVISPPLRYQKSG